MNIKALDKLQKSYVKRDWKEVIHTVKFTPVQLEEIIDIIDIFKRNRSAKTLVIAKYKMLPMYITVERKDYVQILDWINEQFIKLEMYEKCINIVNIKSML